MAETKQSSFKPLGSSGLYQTGGRVYEEWLHILQGQGGLRLYREMGATPVCGGILLALKMLIRSIKWRVEPAAGKDVDKVKAEEVADLVSQALFKHMDTPWQDSVIPEICTMFQYGFAPMEYTLKRLPDGRIGVASISLRSQDSVDGWEFGEAGEVLALNQLPPLAGSRVTIPMSRVLLFRTEVVKGNPEATSILRSAVQPYLRMERIAEAEGRALVRAAGVLLMRLPSQVLNDPVEKAAWDVWARDITENRSGYIMMPSDLTGDSKQYQYDVSFFTADGRRPADMSGAIVRYATDIARSMLADFMMLGSTSSGSRALSSDKTEFFGVASQGFATSIGDVTTRGLFRPLTLLNGYPEEYTPSLMAGDIEPADLAKLGAFVTALIGAGAKLDDQLENHLRGKAGFPPKPLETEQPAAVETGDQGGKPADGQGNDPAAANDGEEA